MHPGHLATKLATARVTRDEDKDERQDSVGPLRAAQSRAPIIYPGHLGDADLQGRSSLPRSLSQVHSPTTTSRGSTKNVVTARQRPAMPSTRIACNPATSRRSAPVRDHHLTLQRRLKVHGLEAEGPCVAQLPEVAPRRGRRRRRPNALVGAPGLALAGLEARAFGLRVARGVAVQAHLVGIVADAAQREDAGAAHARGVHRLTLHGHGEVQRRRRRDAFHGDSRELRELGVRRRQPALHRVAPQLVHLVGGGIQRRLEAVQVLATLL
mmetsp:Transcript_54603/g.156990  ORF Transcript_54603/g.156990 Transcript_54603/m.156990 type:complete len:268 (-) Transcript_54603:664-1467(-)